MNKLIFIGLIGLIGCAGLQVKTPADNIYNETFTYDCCDPGLSQGTKEMCDMAIKDKNHTLVDDYGNKYKFIWSDCKIGKEPWRD